jgi:hypothetical protein
MTVALGDRCCQGPLFAPDLLCTAADQAIRAFASQGLSGVPAAGDGLWWTVGLVLDGGHRCLDGAGGGQQPLWVADPQHPGDCLTGYYCPACAGARAADGDPVQRRETLGPKKSRSRRSRISARQRVRCPRVYSVRVSALDASMSPWALMTVTDDLSRRLVAGEVFMVIPDMRLSPVCSARATALRGQRRTADPIRTG